MQLSGCVWYSASYILTSYIWWILLILPILSIWTFFLFFSRGGFFIDIRKNSAWKQHLLFWRVYNEVIYTENVQLITSSQDVIEIKIDFFYAVYLLLMHGISWNFNLISEFSILFHHVTSPWPACAMKAVNIILNGIKNVVWNKSMICTSW